MKPQAVPPEQTTWDFDNFPSSVAWLQKFTFARLVASFSQYQPVQLGGDEFAAGDRDCARRWDMIQEAAGSGAVSSLLDLGCAEGYFVRRAAKEKGWVCLGVDGDIRRVTVAQAIVSLERIEGAAFIYSKVTPDFVAKVPSHDVVLCLSLMHHIICEHGMDYARRMMATIRSRTQKTLVFDMGQSDEHGHEWSKKLPPMLPDPATWISSFLREAGFSDVSIVGDSKSYLDTGRRILFAATP